MLTSGGVILHLRQFHVTETSGPEIIHSVTYLLFHETTIKVTWGRGDTLKSYV